MTADHTRHRPARLDPQALPLISFDSSPAATRELHSLATAAAGPILPACPLAPRCAVPSSSETLVASRRCCWAVGSFTDSPTARDASFASPRSRRISATAAILLPILTRVRPRATNRCSAHLAGSTSIKATGSTCAQTSFADPRESPPRSCCEQPNRSRASTKCAWTAGSRPKLRPIRSPADPVGWLRHWPSDSISTASRFCEARSRCIGPGPRWLRAPSPPVHESESAGPSTCRIDTSRIRAPGCRISGKAARDRSEKDPFSAISPERERRGRRRPYFLPGPGARMASTTSRSLPSFRMPWGTPEGAISIVPGAIGSSRSFNRNVPWPVNT